MRQVARAAGLGHRRIIGIDVGLLRRMAWLSGLLPFIPRIDAGEILRLTEDKAFDIQPARHAIGFAPKSLEAGLSETFGQTVI